MVKSKTAIIYSKVKIGPNATIEDYVVIGKKLFACSTLRKNSARFARKFSQERSAPSFWNTSKPWIGVAAAVLVILKYVYPTKPASVDSNDERDAA